MLQRPPFIRLFGRHPIASLMVVLVGASWSAAGHAEPGPADDAERLVQRGIAFRRAAKDAEALEQFQRAYELAHTPRIEAQIGAAEQALGRWVDAEAHLEEALAATTDPWISKNRATLGDALGAIRAHMGELDIVGTPPGAEIRIDGRVVGRLPLEAPIRVAAGSVVVELRAPDHFPATRTVSVVAEQLTRETMTLQPVRAENPSAGPPSPPPLDDKQSPPVTPAPPGHETDGASGRSWRMPVALALGGGAVALAGVGIAAGIIRNNKASEYNHLVDTTNCADTNMAACGQLKSDGNTARNVAIVGFSVAGALAISSVIVLVTAPRAPEPLVATLRACAADGSARGIVCHLSF